MVVDAAELRGHVWAMAQTPAGTWAVQSALENAPDDVERSQLVQELRGHAWAAMRCRYAHYALQKCLMVARSGTTSFIVDELLGAGPGAVVRAAKHRYACRLVQRILEHLPTRQLTDIVHELVAQSVILSKHMFGHSVVRSLLEQCPGEAHRAISLAIGREIQMTMRSGYGRAVVEDALSLGLEEDQRTLARALVASGEWLRCIGTAGNRYLPGIVRRMMHLLSVVEVQGMCDSLRRSNHCLKHCRTGRRLLRTLDGKV
jgi:mRNA-binding protein PUF3